MTDARDGNGYPHGCAQGEDHRPCAGVLCSGKAPLPAEAYLPASAIPCATLGRDPAWLKAPPILCAPSAPESVPVGVEEEPARLAELSRALASLITYVRRDDSSCAAEIMDAEGALGATPQQAIADYREQVEFAAETRVAASRAEVESLRAQLATMTGRLDLAEIQAKHAELVATLRVIEELSATKAMLAKANEQLGAALEEVNRLHADHRKAQEVLDALGSDTQDTDLLTSCSIVAGDYRGARSGMEFYRRSVEVAEKAQLAAAAFAEEMRKHHQAIAAELVDVVDERNAALARAEAAETNLSSSRAEVSVLTDRLKTQGAVFDGLAKDVDTARASERAHLAQTERLVAELNRERSDARHFARVVTERNESRTEARALLGVLKAAEAHMTATHGCVCGCPVIDGHTAECVVVGALNRAALSALKGTP